MPRQLRSLLAAAAASLVAAGCGFDSGALPGPGVVPADGPLPDAAPADTPLPPPADGGGDAAGCSEGQAVCSGNAVLRCQGDAWHQETTCALGCKLDEARCYRFTAANVADGALEGAFDDLVIDGDHELDVEQGLLDGVTLPAGVDWALEAPADPPQLGVIRVHDFTITAGSRLLLTGNAAAVFLASGRITIDGVLDAAGRGASAGPGGWGGGTRGAAGLGPGGGSGGLSNVGDDSGGAGGGSGASGGTGAKGGAADAVTGGAGAPDRSLEPLFGGAGGGGGSGDGNPGGGGGGAVQLSAAVSASVAGRILVGGGGGGAGTFPFLGNAGAGSGGGGGGAVLIEAPAVSVTGVIAAGGGGGGGAACWTSGDGSPGEDAVEHEDGTAAQGGAPGCSGEGQGGAGGALDQPASAGSTGGHNGGGGGGGSGRLHFSTWGSQAVLTGTLSPSVTTGLVAQTSLARL
jgi:hypothetical protein